MKMCKRLFSFLLLLTIIANFLVMQAFAHRSVLYVDYDECVSNKNLDGLDETWYILQTSSACTHISDEVKTIKYYFEPLSRDGTYTWTTDASESIAQEIKDAYANSMKKWNNVYFYSYNAYGVLIKYKIIDVVEGTADDHNLSIHPKAGTEKLALTYTKGNSEYMESEGTVDHLHCNEWGMDVYVKNFYISSSTSSEANVETARERTGAHELGHVLGLRDVDNWCTSSDDEDWHHRELLMGYGKPLYLRAMNITYKDIAGVAITRGFHTDNDHKWINYGLQSDGNYKLVCSICNGVKQVTSLSGYTYETYGACNSKHTLSYGNMMAVASYGTKDYYKCKYCRYVARFESNVEQNYTKTFHTDYLHKCVNTVNGLEYTFYEEHTVVNHECTGCGEHIHSYSKRYVWQTDGRHKCYCECGEFITASHVVLKDSFSTPDGYGICIQCRGRVFMGVLLSNGVDELPHTENGSYLLPNGTVVLAEADLDAYLKGELIFYSGETE